MAILKLNLVVVLTIMVAYMQFQAMVAVDHVVGGKDGWVAPPGKAGEALYTDWVKAEKFAKGDTLIFNFLGVHTVGEVTKEAYAKCDIKDAKNVTAKSPAKFTLTAGVHYYVCTLHCSTGQKVTVEVK